MAANDQEITNVPGEEEYNSASDEDFDPSAATTVPVDSSASEDDEYEKRNAKARKSKKKDLSGETQESDLDFDNSGDEGIISRGRRKAKRKGAHLDDEDEGGEGGLIKTRAQRREEKTEKKKLASTEGSTVDIEKLWSWMNATPVGKRAPPPPLSPDLQRALGRDDNSVKPGQQSENLSVKTAPISVDEEMITISRSYTFAGKVTTETKLVPKSSAEAQLWLAEQAANSTTQSLVHPTGLTKTNFPLRRPLLRKSMFDDDAPAASSLILGPASQRKQAELKAGKLTTVEKSKLDWAGYVDQEGIGQELGEARKGKQGYMSRMDFLGRVEDRKEAERRAAKAKPI